MTIVDGKVELRGKSGPYAAIFLCGLTLGLAAPFATEAQQVSVRMRGGLAMMPMKPWKLILLVLLLISLTGCLTLYRDVAIELTAYRGPIATVPMVLMGPPSSDEQTRADRDLQTRRDSSGCENLARYAEQWAATGGVEWEGPQMLKWTGGSFGSRPEANTNAYVWCMGYLRGYRCVDRSENRFCKEAWIHPTATQTQFLHDQRACRKRAAPVFLAFASTIHARFNECMTARGYHKDVE